jgi:hypothetical protein
VAPFHYYELAAPGMRAVLKSYDAVGGPHTRRAGHHGDVLQGQSEICQAVLASHEEANAFIKKTRPMRLRST